MEKRYTGDMIYKKLPIVLLSTMASEKNDSTNYLIASYLLAHKETAGDLKITELAERCHVGTGSVSRFVRDIGLSGYHELSVLLKEDFQLPVMEEETPERICDEILSASRALDQKKINELCRAIRENGSVAAFGLLKAQAPVIMLQADLLMQKKLIITKTAYADQLQYLRDASLDDLILIFSFSGAYFDYPDVRALKRKLDQMNIWMIGSGKCPSFIHHHLFYPSDLSSASHPWQLMIAAEQIAVTYQKMYNEKD